MEKGSVWTAIGHGWVAPKRKANALQRMFLLDRNIVPRKGIWLKFQNDVNCGRLRGNATRLRHSGMGTEKSLLFFLTYWNLHVGIPLRRENVTFTAKFFHFWKNSVLSLRSLKIAGSIYQRFSRRVGVLKTASGFQGEQPLVHRRMWVKEFGKIDS